MLVGYNVVGRVEASSARGAPTWFRRGKAGYLFPTCIIPPSLGSPTVERPLGCTLLRDDDDDAPASVTLKIGSTLSLANDLRDPERCRPYDS